MLSNDLSMGSVILAYILVNHLPFDIGLMFCKSLPVTLVTTVFSQLFKALGIMKFVGVCFDAFKENPSAYYPIPVFGPILYAILLGNMAGLVLKGLNGHVENGMPWPVQNGEYGSLGLCWLVIICNFPCSFSHKTTFPHDKYIASQVCSVRHFIIFLSTTPLVRLAVFCGVISP
jgi:hypothetical protein